MRIFLTLIITVQVTFSFGQVRSADFHKASDILIIKNLLRNAVSQIKVLDTTTTFIKKRKKTLEKHEVGISYQVWIDWGERKIVVSNKNAYLTLVAYDNPDDEYGFITSDNDIDIGFNDSVVVNFDDKYRITKAIYYNLDNAEKKASFVFKYNILGRVSEWEKTISTEHYKYEVKPVKGGYEIYETSSRMDRRFMIKKIELSEGEVSLVEYYNTERKTGLSQYRYNDEHDLWIESFNWIESLDEYRLDMEYVKIESGSDIVEVKKNYYSNHCYPKSEQNLLVQNDFQCIPSVQTNYYYFDRLSKVERIEGSRMSVFKFENGRLSGGKNSEEKMSVQYNDRRLIDKVIVESWNKKTELSYEYKYRW